MSIETLAVILAAISLGAFSKGLTGIGLPMISIPALVFVRLGMRMTRRISSRLFDRLILGLIVVMKLKLARQLFDGA
jgi:uncharacterized membrane protein YfcA